MPLSPSEFASLSQEFASLISPNGFAQVRIEQSGPFGSHYSEYAKDAKRYRFVWDGKESWLLAEYCDNFQGVGRSSWNDIAIVRAGREASANELTAFGRQVIDALRVHLASNAA